MSDLSATDLSALSSLDPTAMPTVLPPDVRAAGAKGEQLYQSALGFEQLLTQSLTDQLASQMSGTDSTDGSDDSDGTDGSDSTDDPSTESIFPSDDSSSSMLSELLPQALSDGITAAGGLGVAHQLYLMLAQQSGISTFTGSDPSGSSTTGAAPTSGGTASSGQ
jgi:Rod binding domain-containing protein